MSVAGGEGGRLIVQDLLEDVLRLLAMSGYFDDRCGCASWKVDPSEGVDRIYNDAGFRNGEKVFLRSLGVGN